MTRRGFGAALGFALVIALAASVTGSAQSEDGFVKIFDGTLDGWTIENSTAGNFVVRDGVLRVEGPAGWLRSAREYGDVDVRMEFRFVTPDADSGLFVRAATGSQFGRGWPGSAYQIQMRNPATESRFPPVGGLFRHGVPPGETTFDAAVVDKAVRPTGEWQVLDVEVRGDRLTARLNGTQVLAAANIVNPRGFIGLQGETGAMEVRSIAVREAR